MLPSPYTLVDFTAPPANEVNLVHPPVYYAVVRRNPDMPTPPVPIQAFRVAEGRARHYFAVAADTPPGPWAGPHVQASRYLGSLLPRATTPERAIADYYDDLGSEVEHFAENARTATRAIAAEQAKLQEASARGETAFRAREALLAATRTIPEITDERIAELVSRLPPVVREHSADPFAAPRGYVPIEIPDFRKVAFTWNPTLLPETLQLVTCGTATTYHNWGASVLFKPSLAEVYACIDGQIPDEAEFFCLSLDSDPDGTGPLHKPDLINRSGYHRAQAVFLRREP